MIKKCRACKEQFVVKYTSTQIVCSQSCAFEYAVAQRMVKYNAETRRRRKEFKAKNLPHQLELTKKAIQKYVVLRDRDLPCISCGTTKNVQYCGGHFKTAGGFPELALDEKNINKQCNRYCNMALSGNITGNKTSMGYTKGILARFGQDRLDYLERKHEAKHYKYDDYVAIRKKYTKKTRELQKIISALKDL